MLQTDSVEKVEKVSDTVDAVLMACGFSKRFGTDDKLLVPFRGKALARHTLDLVFSLSHLFNRIFFVAANDSVLALAQDLPFTVIKNENPEQGQRESIRLGVQNSCADYYLFFPCDQPLLDQDTVTKLIAARKKGRIVQSFFQGNPGNPVLFSDVFRQELLNLGKGERGRDIIRRNPHALITVELDRGEPLLDIDTPEMLKDLLKISFAE